MSISTSTSSASASISALEATRTSVEKGAGFLLTKKPVLFFGEVEWRKCDEVKPVGHRSTDIGYIFSDRLTSSTIRDALNKIEPSNPDEDSDTPIVITVPRGVISTHNGLSSKFEYHKMFLQTEHKPIPLAKRNYTLLFSSRKCKWIKGPVEEFKTNPYVIQSYIADLILTCDLLIIHEDKSKNLQSAEITKPQLNYKPMGPAPGSKSQ